MPKSLSSLFKSNRGKNVRLDGSIPSFVWHIGTKAAYKLTKDELCEAGLGVKEIEFDSVDMSAEKFREVICECHPKLKNADGYMFF